MMNFETRENNLHYQGVVDIDPEELVKKKDQVFLVDVRQPDEFHGELGHIPGARLITLDTLSDHMDELPKNQTVVFVCRSGGRSARAHSVSASSRCAINRLRSWIASPSDFIVNARSATPGRLKKFVTDPSARTR